MKTCYTCGGKVKGNTSSAETTAFKCCHCCNGEVEHIRNNPDKFHVIDNSVKKKSKMGFDSKKNPKGTTLATC